MENVEIKETKRGKNPKYCLLDIPLEIVTRKDSNNGYTVHLQSKGLSYKKITGTNDIEKDRHSIYITSIHKKAIPSFCESLINQVRSLSNRGVTLSEIVTEIYTQYHNEEKTKTEMVDLQSEFREIKKDFNKLQTKINGFCKKLERI